MNEKKILKCTHNAGFFSCTTLALIAIMKYFNEHKELPETVDRSEQFAFYKKSLDENIVPAFFEENDTEIIHTRELSMSDEPGEVSFGDYSKLHLADIAPFAKRYFSPSKTVGDIVYMYQSKYAIDYENTCAIFYRGNDKQKECIVTPHEDFINKAKEMLQANPDIKFLVQPDETEFLESFTAAFPNNCFWFEETPHMRKKDSAIFYELPLDKKTEHGQYFLAAVIAMSKCKHLITHSGNGSMWAVIYRGNFDNVFQFRNKHIY